MKKDSLNTPKIVIDSKNSRIRIHRNTLHLLGNPEYIQLLVNPEQLTLAILSSPKQKTANAVRWDKIAESQSCELYSKILIRQLVVSARIGLRMESIGCMESVFRMVC